MFMNEMKVYKFPEHEIRRYAHHGLAIAKLSGMAPFPIGGCLIDMGRLIADAKKTVVRGRSEVSPPAVAWVKRKDDTVEVLVSARGHTPDERSSISIDPSNEVEFIRFSYHPKAGFGSVALEPIYKAVKEPREAQVAACSV